MFRAPVDGVYLIECRGASGGSSHSGGAQGGISRAHVRMKAGQVLYVYVGGAGGKGSGGWNGGGSMTEGYHLTSGGGGGATDIRLNSALTSRIIVAGGGGGGNNYCCSAGTSGVGGGLVGGTGNGDGYISYGGTQTGPGGVTPAHSYNRFGGFGYGIGPYSCGGASGGGWYGGSATWGGCGGGGSSYILDYPGCSTAYCAYQHSLADITVGRNIGSKYTYSMQQGGNSGHGFAQIVLTENL